MKIVELELKTALRLDMSAASIAATITPCSPAGISRATSIGKAELVSDATSGYSDRAIIPGTTSMKLENLQEAASTVPPRAFPMSFAESTRCTIT